MPLSKNENWLQFLGFLHTPPLWKDLDFFDFPQFLLKEKQQAKISGLIPEAPNNVTLGRRMEYFFHHYIKHFTKEEVLAVNEQVISNKITLGEFDFILKNPLTNEIFHVELIYKFYIYYPFFKIEKERWIGPNRRDTLVKKLEKLKNSQFPLLYKPESRPLLEKLNIPAEKIQQKVCFKALLFLPKDFQKQKIPQINTECISGYWIKFDDFTSEAYKNHLFHAPEKQNWPVDPKYCHSWHSFDEIREQIRGIFKNKKSPLLWMKKSENEFERFFVVHW